MGWEIPSNEHCCSTAVVSTSDGEYLIVIGGLDGGGSSTATVELFKVEEQKMVQTNRLTTISRLYPSATILCGDIVHVIGCDGDGYSCCLAALPSSDKPIPPQSILHLISWKPLPHLAARDVLNSCHSLWTASTHWWQAIWVSSRLHSSASGWTVGGDWLYD